jgi:hypothetical protein
VVQETYRLGIAMRLIPASDMADRLASPRVESRWKRPAPGDSIIRTIEAQPASTGVCRRVWHPTLPIFAASVPMLRLSRAERPSRAIARVDKGR